MKNLISLKFLLASFCLLVGCSSARSLSFNTSEYTPLKVCIPLIEGDKQGQLTAMVIRKLCSQSMTWNYEPVQSRADYVVHLAIINAESNPLGFKYDSLNVYDSSHISDFIDVRVDRLVQDEVRRVIVLEGRLCKGVKNKQVGDSFRVEGSCDYDYLNSYAVFDAAFINQEGDLESVLDFSLGQLDGLDGAQTTSTEALYSDVADNFIEGLNHLYYSLQKEPIK